MEYIRVNNDVNGNPKYVFSFFAFLSRAEANSNLSVDKKYDLAIKKAKTIGGKKYHNKSYGGGIAIQSYNIASTVQKIKTVASKSLK